MLVLTRKKNESIMVGDDIEIVLLEINANQVRIGVRAPKEYAVFRKEIFLEIQEENIKAAQQAQLINNLAAEVKELFQAQD
ncbi:MAG: carbon storage regulator CsrA [Clostridia bacterium]|jgi:carbon storage regulator|nr:carbon storage regulator CsrA [Clostridia bacterium]